MPTLDHITLHTPTLADVPELARMHVGSWMATYRGAISDADLRTITPEGFERFHALNFLPAGQGGGLADPKRVFFVAREARADDAGRIVGFVRAGPNRDKSPRGDPLPASVYGRYTAELYAIYLLPEFFGSGLGRVLLRRANERLRVLGHTSMCVWVLEANAIGRRFYERLGGAVVGVAPFSLGEGRYAQVAYGWDGLPGA